MVAGDICCFEVLGVGSSVAFGQSHQGLVPESELGVLALHFVFDYWRKEECGLIVCYRGILSCFEGMSELPL